MRRLILAAGCVGLVLSVSAGALSAPPAPAGEGAPAAGARPVVERARLVEFIRALPTQRAADGDEAHRTGLRAAEDLVIERLGALGLRPEAQEFMWRPRLRRDPNTPLPEPSTWRNILVEFPGTDLAHEVVVVGAHIDAVPNSPGADDNASGAAALLELARVLKDEPRRRTLRLIFFNLEEVGLVGSRAYVESLDNAARARIVGMVSLEMLGYYSDAPGSQQSPIPPIEGVWDPPTVGDTIALVGLARDRAFSTRLVEAMLEAESRVKVTRADFLPVPVPDMMRSDHAPFVAAGLAGFMLTDTANFRNPHYHTPGDTLETLDLERYERVVRSVAGALVTLGNAESWAPEAAPVEPGAAGEGR